jgi:hypothetical protein
LALIHDFSGLEPGDRVLMLTPFAQFEHGAALATEPEVATAPAVSS